MACANPPVPSRRGAAGSAAARTGTPAAAAATHAAAKHARISAAAMFDVDLSVMPVTGRRFVGYWNPKKYPENEIIRGPKYN